MVGWGDKEYVGTREGKLGEGDGTGGGSGGVPAMCPLPQCHRVHSHTTAPSSPLRVFPRLQSVSVSSILKDREHKLQVESVTKKAVVYVFGTATLVSSLSTIRGRCSLSVG